MPALVGRDVTFTPTVGGVPVTGMRTKTITINNEAIDITSDDDLGFRTLLDTDPSERSIDISVDGVTKDDDLIALAAAGGGNLVEEYTLDFPTLGSFVGNFYIGTLELGAAYQDAVTFSATIQSTGAFVYTPATTA